MAKSLFSFFCVALAILAGAALYSCNKDDVIESTLPPKIELDSENGIYTVAVGKSLTIAPVYKNMDGGNVSYKWSIDGQTVATTPSFTSAWPNVGEYYVIVTATNDAGSASEEILVKVTEPAAPVISLPVSSAEITIAAGTEYVITPEISNSDVEGFAVTWTVNGKEAGKEATFKFSAEETGTYAVSVTATNADGSDTRTFNIKVVDKLPYELSFPTPGYLIKSTARYTFAGRPVYLTPIIGSTVPTVFSWSVDGKASECSARTFVFTPQEPGEYTVNLTVDGGATAGVKVICVDATESSRYRAPTASSSASATTVFEWIPAPGQFINDTGTGGMTGAETTPQLANAWAKKRLDGNSFVTLGGFGGHIIVGFDHSISKKEGNYDFSILANAFLNATTGTGGSNEPGIVYVMQDVNGNGLPDDEWYELRGSETGNASTRQDYAVTYFRPASAGMNVQWSDNYGAIGTIDYLGAFHRQDYYYPAWIDADSYTLRGTCLAARTSQDASTGFWDNSAFAWGYADNMGSDNITGGDGTTGEGQRNGFLIENAMFPDLTHINLQYIDFIKVQTGINSKAGWLGEVSTEVFGFRDLNISK